MTTPHPLYLAALAADEHLTALCQAHGCTRYTANYRHPGLRQAYRDKVAADAAWLDAMRQDSQQRTARKVLDLVESGTSPVDALRDVCGANLVNDMIGEVYDTLRRKTA